jgi:hypothetical protein
MFAGSIWMSGAKKVLHGRPPADFWSRSVVTLAAVVGTMTVSATAIGADQGTAAAVQATDPLFTQPYIDIDEWRAVPVRHRYVHGGFKDTETRFSFYFPPKVQYRGRFFQHITPVPDDENLAQKAPPGGYNKIGFAIDSGAYFIETNGGGKFDLGKIATTKMDPTISAYRANAAAAQFSRVVATKMYGGKRPYGYAYGGSGGGYRTIGSIENTHGVWDGVVPYVIGSTMAIPNMFTARMQALRVLRDKFPQIIDAVEPGGNGDPYAGLSDVEAEALREVTRMGFPIQSWFGYKYMGVHGFAALYQGVVRADPTYFTDFWTKPGYLGFDHPERFARDRIQYAGTIAMPITAADAARQRINIDASSEANRGGVDTAFKIPEGSEGQRIVAYRLKAAPPATYFLGGDLIVQSGAAKDKRLPLARIVGDVIVLGVADSSVAALVAAADEVQVDNSNFLAAETYHRHQVPGPDFKVWDQFRKGDGTPLYPQRPRLLGPNFVMATAGSLETGAFDGKMIVVESLWDREAYPWQADWYRERVREHIGGETDNHFRLWYTDHALHGDVSEQVAEDPTRIVSYQGVLQEALRDLAAWVEKGVAPPQSTNYHIDDGKVIVPATAAERRGIQPVATLKANGGERADVAAGQSVTFTATIEMPPQAGKIVAADWDFEGAGDFPVRGELPKSPASRATLKTTYAFTKPGTYFAALRVIGQRHGDVSTPYARIENLARVRVVVR